VVLPARGEARERWLSRSELSLWAAWRMRQSYKGEATARRTGARFILTSLYTGSRAGTGTVSGQIHGTKTATFGLEQAR
jgi:hypothetical protein